ncbi:MAG: DUF1830 domain-containing protein [Cyanobacteria bacterium P01_A01_bin.135]
MLRKGEKVRYFLCCYQNASDGPVLLCVPRQRGGTIEQQIAPGEQLLFSATEHEMVEIYQETKGDKVLMAQFASAELRYISGDEVP